MLRSLALYVNHFAQLAGAVEYTDCISAEGYDHPQWVSWIWH